MEKNSKDNELARLYQKENFIEILKEKGWDVGVNAKWLQDYYLNLMKRNG